MELSREEKSLLLYLESCMVDNRGRMDSRKINDEDEHILIHWREIGFIDFGRIHPDEYMLNMGGRWIELSDDAWELASIERYERSVRMLKNRAWIKSDEWARDERLGE